MRLISAPIRQPSPRTSPGRAPRWRLARLRLLLLPLLGTVALSPALTAQQNFQRWSVELPAAPVAVVAADVNEDGWQDLTIAVAFTRWEELGIEESRSIDEIDGLVEVLTIVPALLDRRSLYLFLGGEDGYRQAGEAIDLPLDVVGLFPGPGAPGLGVVALTDSGLSRVVWDGAQAGEALENSTEPTSQPQSGPRDEPRGEPGEEPLTQSEAGSQIPAAEENSAPSLRLEPVLEERSILAGTGTFLPSLTLVHDLDGDQRQDLLLPTRRGLRPYLATEDGLVAAPVVRVPEDESSTGRRLFYPLPEVRDLSGDGLPELIFADRRRRWQQPTVIPNLGAGRFAHALSPLAQNVPWEPSAAVSQDSDEPAADEGESPPPEENAVALLDLDGDGRGEYVTEQNFETSGGGLRQELKAAQRPRSVFRVYGSGTRLAPSSQALTTLDVEGYAFGDDDAGVGGGFTDLDGDGLQDLVTITLDFSLFEAVRVMATQRIHVDLDFHVYCQTADGSGPRFRRVPDLDLSGRFRLDLDNLSIGRIAQFAGDFNGDGRADFVQMGRGREVTVHLGREGCRYPSRPDLTLRLDEEPADLSLVKVDDYDADGLADLLILVPRPAPEAGVTPPVRLDLYRSGASQ
ncbi:MAG: VCBS repeat-containing protein [Acidobacteriota bacterium]